MKAMDRESFAVHSALEQSHWWFQARREILRRVVDALTGKPRGMTIVDIGCGVGATLAAFHPDHHAVGYDPSADAIAFGRERHPGIDLRVGGIDEARAGVAAADVVLLNDVIEHVADDRALLRPIVAAMRAGAILVVTVPADMRLWSAHDEALGHFRRYNVALLARATEGEPLHPLFVSYFNSRLYPVVFAARSLGRLRRARRGADELDIRPTPPPLNAALRRCFAGEARRLLGVIAGTARPYRRGVSLISAYRRLDDKPVAEYGA